MVSTNFRITLVKFQIRYGLPYFSKDPKFSLLVFSVNIFFNLEEFVF